MASHLQLKRSLSADDAQFDPTRRTEPMEPRTYTSMFTEEKVQDSNPLKRQQEMPQVYVEKKSKPSWFRLFGFRLGRPDQGPVCIMELIGIDNVRVMQFRRYKVVGESLEYTPSGVALNLRQFRAVLETSKNFTQNCKIEGSDAIEVAINTDGGFLLKKVKKNGYAQQIQVSGDEKRQMPPFEKLKLFRSWKEDFKNIDDLRDGLWRGLCVLAEKYALGFPDMESVRLNLEKFVGPLFGIVNCEPKVPNGSVPQSVMDLLEMFELTQFAEEMAPRFNALDMKKMVPEAPFSSLVEMN